MPPRIAPQNVRGLSPHFKSSVFHSALSITTSYPAKGTKNTMLTRVPLLDDSDEETTSSSSGDAPAAIPRRAKFDDEEDDSDVSVLRSISRIPAYRYEGARILGCG